MTGGDEEVLQKQYGLETMAALVDKLNKILAGGSTRDQFIGTFAANPPELQPIWIYTELPNGNLMWARQDAAKRGTAPNRSATVGACSPTSFPRAATSSTG